MSLKINDRNQLDIQGKVNIQELNYVIDNLVENDICLEGGTIAPQIWECKWYNKDNAQASAYGYSIGQAVWLNTENTSEFVLQREQDIYDYAIENPKTRNLVTQLSSPDDRQNLLELYAKIVNGLDGYKRLFYLGTYTDDTQIRISLSNNNTAYPNDDRYWKDFIRRDLNNDYFSKQIIDSLASQLSVQYETHRDKYHSKDMFEEMRTQEERDGFFGKFMKKDLSNNENYQVFNNHTYLQETSGLDYVVNEQFITYEGGCSKWFRKWKSGLLEHGGIIDGDYPSRTGDTTEYDGDFCKINLNFKYGDNIAPTYDYQTNAFGSIIDPYSKIDTKNGKGQKTYQNTAVELAVDNRYQVSITKNSKNEEYVPYSKKNEQFTEYPYYENSDILHVTNTSFMARKGNESMISYYIRGFVTE